MAVRKIGALWDGRGESKSVYTGNIELLGEQIKFAVFENDRAENPRSPRYNICRITDEERRGGGSSQTRSQQQNISENGEF